MFVAAPAANWSCRPQYCISYALHSLFCTVASNETEDEMHPIVQVMNNDVQEYRLVLSTILKYINNVDVYTTAAVTYQLSTSPIRF